MSEKKRNSMLIELLIVILFFSISVAIIMQLFVAASDRSKQSQADNLALLYAEDMAERLMASEMAMEAYLQEAGWQQDGDDYKMAFDADGRQLLMVASNETEATAAGALDSMTLTVLDGERVSIALPVTRYAPGEAVL